MYDQYFNKSTKIVRLKKPDLKDFTITFTCICVQQKTWSTAWNESSVTMHAGKCPCTSGFFVECSTLSKMTKNYKNTTAREKNYSVHCVSIVFTTLFSPTFLKILRKIRWLAILPCLCYGVDYRWWPSKREKREKL